MQKTSTQRLVSLDMLRGFDLWLLLFFGPVVRRLCACLGGVVFWDWMSVQTKHPQWEGFVLWDIIMPLFIFMSGATIPFSLGKYRSGLRPDSTFWLRLCRRVLLLFFLGWIVQGNLLSFDIRDFHPFANTLQAIAVGYAFSAIAYVYGGVRWQIIVSAVFFLIYFTLFASFGQLHPDMQNNVAMWVDKAVLGCHRDGVSWAEDGSWSFKAGYTYTWIVSSLNFTCTAVMGSVCGHILKNGKSSKSRRSLILVCLGAILIAAGLTLSLTFPIIKKIWSSSMTLFSGGICTLLLCCFYYVFDVRGWGKGLGWLKYYGMNSIAAYCIGEAISFKSVSVSLFHGFERLTPEFYPVILAFSNAVILLLILRIMYKRNIFLRV